MKLKFPEGFLWGTSTAAAQIETASDHNWNGVKSKDGFTFNRTIDHELRREEDAEYISRFGSVYRCGVDWARLQKEAFAPFDQEVVKEYRDFFALLNSKGVKIMFVIHHFTNPMWFEEKGSWLNEDLISAFVDYAKRCIDTFGDYAFIWNTFNEPNVYCMNAFMLGNFPPHQKSYFKANKAIKHMGMAHDILVDLIKQYDSQSEIGISLNTAWFDAQNILGKIPAKFTDWWFHTKAAKHFKKVDFWGISYYAYIPFTPIAVTEIDHPGRLKKMNIPHDQMWGYKPEGLGKILRRFHTIYRKPIIITENGICTPDPQRRISSLKDYLSICHQAIKDGVKLKGYMHWSTFDNFEWHLGPTYNFGLVSVDMNTMDRTMTPAGEFYENICQTNEVII